MSVYSSVAKSIRKKLNMQTSFQGSQKGSNKRDKAMIAKKADAPVPVKLDNYNRQLHSDNLDEQHFVELRQFLYKKQRQDHLATKIITKTGRGGSNRAGPRMPLNEDLGRQSPKIDREINTEIVGGQKLGSPNASKVTTKGGQQVLYTTKERTQCMENDRFLITKKVNVGALPDPSQKQAQVCDASKITTTIEKSAKEVHEAYLLRI